MNNSYPTIRYFLFFLVLFGFASCKTSRILAPTTTHELSITELKDSIFNYTHLEWFSGKAKVRMTDNYGSQKGVMHIRMKNDSVVWMVLKKLSYEAARVQINVDSITILDRINKTYQSANLDSVTNVFGLSPDFNLITDFMIGRVPELDTSRLWKTKKTDSLFLVRSAVDDVVMDLEFDLYTGSLLSGQFYDRFILEGQWDYSDYRRVNGHRIPFERKFHINFDGEKFLDLEIEFQEISIDKSYNLKFEIPEHYSRVH